MTDTKRHEIYLAALLHDIGKFYQRADKKYDEAEFLKKEAKNLAQSVCKDQKTHWGYLHVLWTLQFFNDHVQTIENIRDHENARAFKNNIYFPGEDDIANNLVNLSIYHHRPRTNMQAIIQVADWWSSGIERNESTLETEDDSEETKKNNAGFESINWGKNKFKKVPLQSIFQRVQINKKKSDEIFYHYPLSKLNPVEKVNTFPISNSAQKPVELNDEYRQLWEDFVEELEVLPTDSIEGFTESLFYLLQKYTWSIPASTNDMVDISLFEHLKTTGAIAQCLYDYQNESDNNRFITLDERSEKAQIKEGHYPLMLVCGDFSGIQKFIFDIHSSKAAKSLKGRSFYLQLLTETVIQKIIANEKIQATWGHVIYASGGKFFMLLPNTSSVKNGLKEVDSAMEKEFFEEHRGSLYLCMDYVPFALESGTIPGKKENEKIKTNIVKVSDQFVKEKGFEEKPHYFMGDLWKFASDAAAMKKTQKFQNLVCNDAHFFETLFGSENKGLGDGGDLSRKGKNICAVTGEEGYTPENSKKNPDANKMNTLTQLSGEDVEADEETYVLNQVKEQIDLGKSLKNADYFLTYRGNEKEDENPYLKNRLAGVEPLNMKINHYLFPKVQLAEKEKAGFRQITSADVNRVRLINSTDFNRITSLKGQKCSYGFMFYGGNEQAMTTVNEQNKENREKYFHELAGEEEQKFRRLGVLRMDVDGLGQVFIHGFAEEEKSFAAYATLSNQLNYFFSGYLNNVREQESFKDHINILYSGGDDLFVIGRWDKVIDFAEIVRNEFRAFVCNRDDLSLSGGVVLVNPKFPIQKAAEMAGEAEDKAKDFKLPHNETGKPDKNAFCMFDTPVSWANEFKFVQDWKGLFLEALQNNTIGKSLIYKLYHFKYLEENEKKQAEGKETLVENPIQWRFHLAYLIKRRANNDNRELLDKLYKEVITGNGESIPPLRSLTLIVVAARWAEYLNRM